MLDILTRALHINAPSDLGEQAELTFETHTELTWAARTRLGFDYHWLREVTGNVLDGELGIKVETSVKASLHLGFSGHVRTVVALDPGGWLRLQFFKPCQHESDGWRIGVAAEACPPLPDRPDPLLAALLGAPGSQEYLHRGLASFADFGRLPDEVRRSLTELLGPIQSESDFARVGERLRPVFALSDVILRKAVAALESKYAIELSGHYQSAGSDCALIDCSFAFTAEGLVHYRRALMGDLRGVLAAECEHVRMRPGRLSHGVRRQTALELHLPLLDKKRWKTRLESLGRMNVKADENGRLLVCAGDALERVEHHNLYQSTLALVGARSLRGGASTSPFTLSYSDRRRLRRCHAGSALAPLLRAYGIHADIDRWLVGLPESSEQIDAGFTLGIPGSAVAAWLQAPEERTMDFYRAFVRVSSAVQRSLRRWLPYAYFSNLDNYDDPDVAFPLLTYQASRPFSRRARADFTYDPMNPSSLALALRNASRAMPGLLQSVHRVLLEAGKTRTAELYSVRRAPYITNWVRRDSRLLRNLLAADALFVEKLVELGNRGRQFQEDLQQAPQTATHHLLRFASQFVKAFHGKLRHLYGGREFASFASLLLVEATSALSSAFGMPAPVEAVLCVDTAGQLPSQRRIFLGGAWLRPTVDELKLSPHVARGSTAGQRFSITCYSGNISSRTGSKASRRF